MTVQAFSSKNSLVYNILNYYLVCHHLKYVLSRQDKSYVLLAGHYAKQSGSYNHMYLIKQMHLYIYKIIRFAYTYILLFKYIQVSHSTCICFYLNVGIILYMANVQINVHTDTGLFYMQSMYV